jgi:DNA-binding IclR family transcriptional regulator
MTCAFGGTQIAPRLRVAIDRRDSRRRTDVIRLVVDQIVHNPESRVTIKDLKDFLNIPESAASRILDSLVKAGLMYEVSPGLWAHFVKTSSAHHVARQRRDV